MKRFLTRSILFILIGIGILIALNNRYTQTNRYRSLNDVEKFRSVPDGIEICNIGTSHGMNAFYYEDINMQGFNFALPSQGFHYDHRVLMQYAGKIRENAVVLIPVSYVSFHIGLDDDALENQNPRYYAFLDKEFIEKFNYFDYIRYRKLPVLSAGENIMAIFTDKKSVKNMWEIRRKSRFEKSELTEEAIKKAQLHLSYIEKGSSNIDGNIRELQNIVEFCRDNSFMPILVTTPFTEQYNVCFTESDLEIFHGLVNGFAERNAVEYLDYSHDEKYSRNHDLFRDADHLNLTGRKMFTEEIIGDLINNGTISNEGI